MIVQRLQRIFASNASVYGSLEREHLPLDGIERLSLGLQHAGLHEQRRRDAHAPESDKHGGSSDGFHDGKERLTDDKVKHPVREQAQRHAASLDARRENLGAQEPGNGSASDSEGHHVCQGARDG